MNRDILMNVCVRSDNITLKKLSSTPLWFIVREFVSTQYFWYLRTRFLMSYNLTQRSEEDWKKTYYILSHAKSKRKIFTRQVSNDLLSLNILLELGIVPTFRAMNRAVEANNFEATRFILQNRRYKSADKDSFVLTLAAECNYVSILSLLIEEGGIDPSYFDSHCLDAAVSGRAVEATKRLLEDSRVDPTANDNAALASAITREYDELIQLLLSDSRVRELHDNSPNFYYVLNDLYGRRRDGAEFGESILGDED